MPKTDAYTVELVQCKGGACVVDPGHPPPGTMQVYVEDGKPLMIDFLCPCGCGNRCPTHVVTIAEKNDASKRSAFKDRCWGFDLETLTLEPSVRWVGGCKAHFNIDAGGRVRFHADSGR